MHLLVNASREDLHKELVAQLYKPELLANLLKEHPEIPAASAKLKKRMKYVKMLIHLCVTRLFSSEHCMKRPIYCRISTNLLDHHPHLTYSN